MERKRKNVIFCCLSLTKKVSKIVKKNFFPNHMSLYDLYVPACRRRKLYLIPEPRYVFSFFWCRLPTEEQKKSFLNSSIYTLLACKRGTLKYEKYRSYSRFPLTDIRFFVFLKSSSIVRKKNSFLNSSIYTLLACKRGSLKCEKCRSYSRFLKTKHLLY